MHASFIDPQLKLQLDYLEGELGRSAWFAGADFSAADIQMRFPPEAFAARGGRDAAAHPRPRALLQRVNALPA